jgi:AmiR/NasT family two-component response regulator
LVGANVGENQIGSEQSVTPMSGTSRLLRDLRSLRVVVFHPSDHDGEEIIRQLQRIGCQVKAFWPPLDKLPDDVDLVFLAVRPEAIGQDFPWLKAEDTPPLIAVVNYENPTVVEAVIKVNAHGVLASPVKSFGLLTSMVIARQLAAKELEQAKSIARLEQRLSGIRRLTKAKAILMETRGISEDQAYEIIRDQAMSKRVTTEEIATAIINANEILGFKGKSTAVVHEVDFHDRLSKPRGN